MPKLLYIKHLGSNCVVSCPYAYMLLQGVYAAGVGVAMSVDDVLKSCDWRDEVNLENCQNRGGITEDKIKACFYCLCKPLICLCLLCFGGSIVLLPLNPPPLKAHYQPSKGAHHVPYIFFDFFSFLEKRSQHA